MRRSRGIRLIGVAKCFHSWRTSTKRVNTPIAISVTVLAVIYEDFLPRLIVNFND